jgi:hypothetical protein
MQVSNETYTALETLAANPDAQISQYSRRMLVRMGLIHPTRSTVTDKGEAVLGRDGELREQETTETPEPEIQAVVVTDAPGYEDFEGVLLWSLPDWPVAVVGFEWEGQREHAVVPRGCVSPLNDSH